ncbi:MAG: DUF2079 domain-containing protein [Anaerolineae bacterium]|nr:DUF2079 domain-containing protein [Anaerolineae bacterium]
MKIPWKRVIQVIVLLLALGFLAALLVSQWQTLQAYEWRLRPGWALLALAGLGLGWLVELGLWRAILSRLGGSLRYGMAARVWFLSNLTRYIPGNVWQFLSMVELAAEQGVSRAATLTSIVLHQVLSTAAGLALAALYFAWAGEGVWFARLRPFLFALPLGLALLQPRLLERGLNGLLTRLGRPPLRVTLSWAQVWTLLAGYALVWLVMGTGFAALVRALTPLSWAQLPRLVAVFAAAYVIGFLSLLTPSGLGVREGVMTLLLTTTLPAGVAAVVAIAARLWMVVGELIGAGATLVAGRKSQVANIQYPIPRLLLVVLIVAYTVGFSALSIRLHEAHLTHTADLGQIDLAIWNTSRGRFVQEIKGDMVSTRLTDHVEPIFAPVSLVFWLWDDVRALLVLQSLALALGALPVFWLARQSFADFKLPGSRFQVSCSPPETRNLEPETTSWLGLLFAFVYLLFPALQAANLTEFHAIPLAVPFILFAFWFAERGQWGRFAVACLLLMAVKEEAALLAFMLGLWAMAKSCVSRFTFHVSRITHHASRTTPLLTGALIAALSLVWFSIATFVIIPRHAAPVYGDAASVYFQRYGELGNSVADILRSLITQPALVWRTVTEPLRLRYLMELLAPVGFLALLAPEILLLGAPLLAANLLSSYAAQYSGQFHYSAPLVPYVVVAAIVGSARLTRKIQSPKLKAQTSRLWILSFGFWILLWALGWQVAHGYTPIGREFRWPEVTAHHRLLERFVAQVPSDAPGSTTPPLYPHLSHREKLYQFPHLADAEWALLDVSATTDMHPVALRDQVQQMLASGQWGVADAADGYLLLRRGQGSAQLPDSFYAFARAENPQPQVASDLTFGHTLRFLGYDVVDEAKWRLTRVRTYWQALKPLPVGLRVYPFFVAADGSVVEDTVARPPVAPLWYPPERWQPGETVIVETLPWFLPRCWGLAIGVLQGDNWEQREQRWRLSPQAALAAAGAAGPAAQDVRVFEDSTWALVGVFERALTPSPLSQGALTPLPLSQGERGEGWPATALGADFGGELELLGHDGLPQAVAAGDDLRLTLHWQALRRPALDYSLFLHLRDGADHTVAQHDSQPTWYGPQPTTTWTVGQPMRSAHTLHLPVDTPPGEYRLVLGVYNWETLQRLPLLEKNGQPLGDEFELGRLRVLAAGEPQPPADLCCALIPECCISLRKPSPGSDLTGCPSFDIIYFGKKLSSG